MKNIAITGICLLCCLNLTSCLETGDVNKDEVQTLNSTIGYVASNPQSDASDRSLPSPDYYKNQLAFSSELSAAYLFSDFEKNMLISPISVRYAFAALSEGAGPNLSGDFTRLLHKGKEDVFQTENALHKTYLNSYFDPNEKNLGLMVQDSIWIDDELKNIKPDFPDKADYSLISDTPLTVGSAIQLTRLKLDNEGVEAAAYTEIKMGVTSVPIQEDETIDMNLNKPYLFSIEFQDGTPLFVGVMNMP